MFFDNITRLLGQKHKDLILCVIIFLGVVTILGAVLILSFGAKSGTININTNIGNTIQNTNNYSNTAFIPVSRTQVNKIIAQAHLDLSRVPAGYFVAIQRIEPLLITLIQNNMDDIVWMRPDVSVGNSFSAYIKKKNPDIYARRQDCTYLYTDQQTNRIPIMCYPMELASEFDGFLQNTYMDENFELYVARVRRDNRRLMKETQNNSK